MTTQQELDDLTPLNFLAHTLNAEEYRKEQALPEGATVCVARWLVTRNDLRTAGRERAKRWAIENMGSVQVAVRTMRASPHFIEWERSEREQAVARGDQPPGLVGDLDGNVTPE